jgi:hypothetical protein
MTALENEIIAEVATLCALHNVASVSPAIRARVAAEVERRHRTRDAASGRPARDPGELLDESTASDPDWSKSPGQLSGDDAPRFTPERSERERLPRRVTAEEQRSRCDDLRYDEPAPGYAAQGIDEGDVGAIKRLNAANKVHYGETGEGDDDYGRHWIESGHDETPRRASPPPSERDPNSSYLRATNYFRASPEPLSRRVPNRTPYVGADYPSGPSPVPPSAPIELYGANFGTATSGYPRSDDPMRVRPDKFNPRSAGVGVGSSDASHLRAWNNFHRQRYGDTPLRSPLPRPQAVERSTEAHDWAPHVRIAI